MIALYRFRSFTAPTPNCGFIKDGRRVAMKARITINMNKGGELEIWLNEEGCDLLVRELQRLGEKNDHFHLMPENMGEVGVSNRPYRDGDTVIEWGKVMFRTEEWDARYFPHVLETSTETRGR
jgi:hypothetical protein